jgi:hypothetical protein
MSLPRSLAWPLCLVALCAFTPAAYSAQPSKHAATNPHASKGTAVSLLGGKLRFTLPAGYQSEPLPPGDASTGTAGAQGTMYMNEAQKRIVVATEIPVQSTPGAPATGDDAFLDGASTGFIGKQAQALPDFHKTQEKRISLNGLATQQIDATASIGGGKTLNTYFIAGAGLHMAVVQVISRENDRAGHEAAVKRITAGSH